jgi:hypothetical protein
MWWSFGTQQSVLRFWAESSVPSGLTPNTCSQVNNILFFFTGLEMWDYVCRRSTTLTMRPSDSRMGGPQKRSGLYEEIKILDPIGTRTPNRSGRYLNEKDSTIKWGSIYWSYPKWCWNLLSWKLFALFQSVFNYSKDNALHYVCYNRSWH